MSKIGDANLLKQDRGMSECSPRLPSPLFDVPLLPDPLFVSPPLKLPLLAFPELAMPLLALPELSVPWSNKQRRINCKAYPASRKCGRAHVRGGRTVFWFPLLPLPSFWLPELRFPLFSLPVLKLPALALPLLAFPLFALASFKSPRFTFPLLKEPVLPTLQKAANRLECLFKDPST